MRVPAALGLAAALALGGCDWVDSTGAQSGDEADGTGGPDGPDLAGPEPAPEPVDGAATVVDLGDVAPGAAIALLEGTRPRVVVPAADGAAADGAALGFAWEEVPLAEGALETCAGIDGFDPARAPATLAEACTDPEACGLAFAPIDPDGGEGGGAAAAAFELAVPVLRAPVGTRRALVGVAGVAPDPAAAGAPTPQEGFRRELDFCLIAINEAPDARDDEYALAADGTLEVDASAGVLANDVDDVDTSNAGLSVSPMPLRAPERAAFFELRPDGSFTYVALPADGNGDGNGGVVDGFEYEASDGVQVASAAVTLRAGSANLAPVPLEGAAPVVVPAGTFVFVDLSNRFVDPEGAPLSFSIVEPLPDDGSLALSPGGTLAGVPGPGDVGEYPLTLVADDGEAAAAAPLLLVVEPAPAPVDDAPLPGPPPGPEFVPGTVFEQVVPLGRTVAPVRPAFDGGVPPLAFGAGDEPLPRGVVVDPASGAVAGRPRRAGTFEGLVVTATDANGAEAFSAPFSIEVVRE